MKMYTTVCPRNCYSTCSMKVYVENNRICRIEANPDNKATPKGVCLRGLSYIERTHSKDRILTPLKRKAGNSEFKPISWDEALDTITEKLQYFKRNFGPQSVLYYSGSGTKGLLNAVGGEFWRLYGGYTTTYGDLCWPAGLEATRLTLGDNKHNAPWDIENAKLIILWGKNTAETNVQQMRSIDRAVEKGARLVVIDPRRTLSADRAELLVQPRPGTDGALALAVGHLLVKNNAVDHDFIKKYVLGFPGYEQMVSKFTPGKAEEITEVPVPYIQRLAEYIAEGSPVSLCPGFGMQRYTNSGQAMRAMIALLAVTGNIGKPGAGWLYANLQSAIFDVIKDPIAFFPPEKPDGVARISISTAKLGQDMLNQKDPPLKMIWVERGNPVTQNPETNTVLKAFRSLDFLVVVEQFFTDTALEADIILPAKTLFEQTDVIGAYWHPYIQLKQKVIDPPGQVKPESEIYRLLAQRLGFSSKDIADKIPGPSDKEIEAYLEKKLEPFPGLSLEQLRKGPILAPGTQEVAFSDFKFPTPSGKIELYSKEASERWGLDPLPIYTESIESIRQPSPESKKYPLYFMTPNTKNRTHSQFNNLKLIRQFSPKPFLEMNPEDAAQREIKTKDLVRVFNDRGSLELEVRIDFSMKKGCVSVTNGWWITEGGTVNFLSLGRETDMGFGAAYHDNLVEVKKLASGGQGGSFRENRPPGPPVKAFIMKQKRFLFDLNRCTGCGACMVACSIEAAYKKNHNEPSQIKSFAGVQGAVFQKSPLVYEDKQINWRQVYTFNETRHPGIPIFNLSMACNHCGEPACMKSCPAAAISKEPGTGAVLVDPGRCLGCKYCTWACPYDAPRYNSSKGVIEKCDFCIDRLKKDDAPACVCSCPTNALRLGDFDPDAEPQKIAGFTNAGLQPAIHFKELRPQQQVPESTAPPPAEAVEELFESSQNIPLPKITLKSEWTLLTFTSIAFILVALLTAAVIIPLAFNSFAFLGVGVVGMVLSTVHLGKKSRVLYAVRNFATSWLSREIVLFPAFLGISFIYLQFLPNLLAVGWAAVFIGFLSLFAVDRIYQVAMQVTPLNFHSAHTLFDGLFLTGVFIGNIFLFSIPGLIKLFLYLYRKFHFKQQERDPRFLISILRIVFGFIIPVIIFFSRPGFPADMKIVGIYGLLIGSVIIGELIDRIEYYDELDIVTPRKQMIIDLEKMKRS